jgi:dienelactone hydrolase
MNPSKLFPFVLWLVVFASASHAQQPAQDTAFNPTGMSKLAFNSNACTGFYNTPTWKCSPITLPAYLLKAANDNAVVFISHGSQGLDKRHSDYAQHLVANGINAVVLGHWEGRGLGKIQFDYDKARKRGGDSPNQVLDVLAAGTQMKAMPEWNGAKFGHIGESMGGTTAMNLTRPYLRRAFNDLYGGPPIQLTAIVSLYAGCTERNTIEAFTPTPLLFIIGQDDDDTLAVDCEKQVPWMNGRGGNTSIIVLPGQAHDFDAPYRLLRAGRAENPAKCANLRDGDKFTLAINGKEYPGTVEGYAQMRKDCIGMTWTGVTSGHKGDPKTDYPEWTKFFRQHLAIAPGS